MKQMRLYFIGLIILTFMIPIGFGYADSTTIDDFIVLSEIVPGENISVAITVSYDFTSNAEINPGIFSFAVDDWIVDKILPVSGSDTVVYTMEFPAPLEDGIHFYQADVWYIIDDTWFFDGIASTYNFTIQVGNVNKTEVVEYVNIIDFLAPESVEISSNIRVNATLDYSLVNETDFSVNLLDSNSEVMGMEFFAISGSDNKRLNFTFISSDKQGEYHYIMNVESSSENSSLVSSKEFVILVVMPDEPEPTEPDIPDTPETPPEVTPPIETDPEPPEIPEDPPTQWRIPGFDIVMILVGSLAVYKHWNKKD